MKSLNWYHEHIMGWVIHCVDTQLNGSIYPTSLNITSVSIRWQLETILSAVCNDAYMTSSVCFNLYRVPCRGLDGRNIRVTTAHEALLASFIDRIDLVLWTAMCCRIKSVKGLVRTKRILAIRYMGFEAVGALHMCW